MFADAEISPVAIDCLCPKKVGWIWRAVALKHFCRYKIAIILFYLQLLLFIIVRSGQTDPTDCGTHTYDAAARPLIAKTVANESKT